MATQMTERTPKKQKQDTALIEVPIAELDGGYCPDMVQVNGLTVRQRENLKRMWLGLQQTSAEVPLRREYRKKVVNYADVIRYLLENAS